VNRVGILCAAGIVAGGILLSAQVQPPEPRKQFGASITGAYEGWYYNPDGSRSFLVGYYNRNSQQTLDIPVGPNNRLEPGGPDLGQPTHFLPGRQWGMFVVPAPKDFKPTDSITWTIVANGQSTSIPLRLHNDYVMSPFKEIAVNNTPPVLRFQPAAPPVQGPLAQLAMAPELSVSVAAPLAIPVWVSDDMKYTSGSNAPPSGSRAPVQLRWSKYRGPGAVTFDKPRPELEKIEGAAPFNGKATTTAKFAEPGDYALHATVNDYSGDGGGGFGCCWTTSVVKVTVK
jgi:hypothetical protein